MLKESAKIEVDMNESKTPTEELTKLRQELIDHLSDEELRDLTFDLGVNYEDLPASGRASKARELVAHLERHGRIHVLQEKLQTIRQARANPPIRPPAPPASGDRETVQRALAMARRTLAILEEQAAAYTTLTIPVHLRVELEEKRREVAELEGRL